jgi:hypothetical protein
LTFTCQVVGVRIYFEKSTIVKVRLVMESQLVQDWMEYDPCCEPDVMDSWLIEAESQGLIGWGVFMIKVADAM